MCQLHYSEKEEQKHKLNDSIYLQGIEVNLNKKDPCIIEINTSPVLSLKAASQTEAQEWLQALTLHVNYP